MGSIEEKTKSRARKPLLIIFPKLNLLLVPLRISSFVNETNLVYFSWMVNIQRET